MKHIDTPSSNVEAIQVGMSSRPLRRIFTREEDEMLRVLFNDGASWPQIASALNRTSQSVRARGYLLGLRRIELTAAQSEVPAKNTLYNREYQRKNPEKRRAHKAVEWALASKTLEKKPCDVCGETSVHAHHDDYSKPLDVRWLCPRCHKAEHAA